MKTERLIIPFKGQRSYLHGTDLYNTALRLLGNEGALEKIEFSANKFIETNMVEVSIYRGAQNPFPTSSSSLRCCVDGVQCSVLYNPIEYSKEIPRAECKENLVMGHTMVEGNVASLQKPLQLSMIETFVPMKKRLMQSMFPDAGVKWVFVRAEIDRDVPRIESAEVECLTLHESRIYQSLLRVNGKSLGKMFFIGVRQ